MPRRHPRIYRRPKPTDGALAEIERVLHEPENVAFDVAPPREAPSLNYRPVVAVIAVVIFSLALIAFIFTLRAAR